MLGGHFADDVSGKQGPISRLPLLLSGPVLVPTPFSSPVDRGLLPRVETGHHDRLGCEGYHERDKHRCSRLLQPCKHAKRAYPEVLPKLSCLAVCPGAVGREA